MKLAETTVDAESVWPGVESALRKALVATRQDAREGGQVPRQRPRAAARNSRWRGRTVRKAAPATINRYREQLHARVKEAGLDVPMDDERLLKEVVIFADRCDITEELTRMESHLKQFREHLNSNEPVGRTLDFLAQEMNREINTIGSKANAAEVSQQVVKMKAELEKIREQMQNIE